MKTRTKNVLNIFKRLAKRLGDDLVYSMVYDNGEFLFCASTHKSKNQTFIGDRQIKTVKIYPTALERPILEVLDELEEYFKSQLTKKEDTNETI